MRALEDGFPERASAEKVRVEDRTARWRRRGRNERRSTSPRGSPRETPPRGTTSRGRAFGKHVNFLEHGVSLWVYQGKYWAQRETGSSWTRPWARTPSGTCSRWGEYQARRNAARRRREKKSQREKKEKESAKREEERAVPEGREDAEDAEDANEDER